MKKSLTAIIIVWLLLLGQPDDLFADYTMMCTYYENPVAYIYKVSDEGDISLWYNMTVTPGGEPDSVVFSSNGHWGIVGCWTTDWLPTQWTILLEIDKNSMINVLDYIYNDLSWLVAISPDSKYGIYGCDLKSLRYYSDGNYQIIPSTNPILTGGRECSFSTLNNHFFCEYSGTVSNSISEYLMNEDGSTTSTGFKLDIKPSNGYGDIKVSPDGHTCIVLSAITYYVTVLRIHAEGGFDLVEQFNSPSTNANEVDFTPVSQYAIITFFNGMRIYRIEQDSHLTETDSIVLPYRPGEYMAITPDGKFVITGIFNFQVVRILEGGKFQYLPEKDYPHTPGSVSALAFVPPQITEANPSWNVYQ